MDKPSRPYKSLADYRIKAALHWSKDFLLSNPSKYPCLECRGWGKIYDPNDPPCQVEGNKMRDRIVCPSCRGSQCSTRKEFSASYREIIDNYEARLAVYRQLSEAKENALAKLTPLEQRALKSLGV